MVIILCWAALGVIGMLMMTWAYAQEKVQAPIADPRNIKRRTFTFGHVLIGVIFGPLAFALGLLYALSMTQIMDYVDDLLSLPLFIWRGKNT